MSYFRSFAVRAVLCVLLFSVLAPVAQASVFINYSVDGTSPPSIFQGDNAYLSSFTGSATLSDGVSQILAIGGLVFNLNDSGSFTGTSSPFDVGRAITINGFGGMLVQGLTITIGSTGDSASVSGGSTTTISLGGGEFVDVTTIAYSTAVLGGGSTTDPIYATFLLHSAPEPTSLSLLAIGALGLFGASRRRKPDPA